MPSEAVSLRQPAINQRPAFMRWVNKTHGWFGPWGALLGLPMGGSGVILCWEVNRRRRLGLAIFGVSVLTDVALAVVPLQS